MPKAQIIKPDQSYTFADYFKLNFAIQDSDYYPPIVGSYFTKSSG